MPNNFSLAVLALSLVPAVALAGGPAVTGGEPAVTAPAPAYTAPRNGLSFTLRGGVAVNPDYFGARKSSVGPDIGFALNHLRFGSLELGSPDPFARKSGFDVHGSVRYIGTRKAVDNPELAGLTDLKAALELGLGIGYTTENFAAFADLRYGVVGHKGIAGEVGADLILRPTEALTLTAGPRVQFGNARFQRTYFGVTAAESAASGLAAFNPGGGIYGAGFEIGANYQINQNWGVEGAATYTRLRGDAALSPIVTQGDRDQFGVRIGLTRRITLGF